MRKIFGDGTFDLCSSSPVNTLLTPLPKEEFSRNQQHLLFAACDAGSQPKVNSFAYALVFMSN